MSSTDLPEKRPFDDSYRGSGNPSSAHPAGDVPEGPADRSTKNPAGPLNETLGTMGEMGEDRGAASQETAPPAMANPPTASPEDLAGIRREDPYGEIETQRAHDPSLHPAGADGPGE